VHRTKAAYSQIQVLEHWYSACTLIVATIDKSKLYFGPNAALASRSARRVSSSIFPPSKEPHSPSRPRARPALRVTCNDGRWWLEDIEAPLHPNVTRNGGVGPRQAAASTAAHDRPKGWRLSSHALALGRLDTRSCQRVKYASSGAIGRSQKDGLPYCRGETFHSRFKVIDAR
jgi:hypothetical protein